MFPLFEIQRSLQYDFQRERLLLEALTHRSYVQMSGQVTAKHNERLEFLGDAVLGLTVSESLIMSFPSCTEGELSKLKAGLISRATLARVARRNKLGEWLRLGRGEEASSGREKHSLLANALEALIGAVYLDGGLEAARALIHRMLTKEFSDLQNRPALTVGGDWKSRLQEELHRLDGTVPRYRLAQESGPDHQKLFIMTVEVEGQVLGKGQGGTKKEAEQHAAEQAISRLSAGRFDSPKKSYT